MTSFDPCQQRLDADHSHFAMPLLCRHYSRHGHVNAACVPAAHTHCACTRGLVRLAATPRYSGLKSGALSSFVNTCTQLYVHDQFEPAAASLSLHTLVASAMDTVASLELDRCARKITKKPLADGTCSHALVAWLIASAATWDWVNTQRLGGCVGTSLRHLQTCRAP